MNLHLLQLLLVSMILSSCDKHTLLKQEIANLESVIKRDQETIIQHQSEIAALGGTANNLKLKELASTIEKEIAAIEFDNSSRRLKWAAIEAEFSKLKPAAEDYKSHLPQ